MILIYKYSSFEHTNSRHTLIILFSKLLISGKKINYTEKKRLWWWMNEWMNNRVIIWLSWSFDFVPEN